MSIKDILKRKLEYIGHDSWSDFDVDAEQTVALYFKDCITAEEYTVYIQHKDLDYDLIYEDIKQALLEEFHDSPEYLSPSNLPSDYELASYYCPELLGDSEEDEYVDVDEEEDEKEDEEFELDDDTREDLLAEHEDFINEHYLEEHFDEDDIDWTEYLEYITYEYTDDSLVSLDMYYEDSVKFSEFKKCVINIAYLEDVLTVLS